MNTVDLMNDIESEIAGINGKTTEKTDKTNDLNTKREELNTKNEEFENIKNELDNLINEKISLQRKLSDIINIINDKDSRGEDKTDEESQRIDLIDIINEVNDKILDKSNEKNTKDVEIHALELEISRLESDIQSLEHEIENANIRKNNLQTSLQGLLSGSLESIKRDYDDHNIKIKKLQNELNRYNDIASRTDDTDLLDKLNVLRSRLNYHIINEQRQLDATKRKITLAYDNTSSVLKNNNMKSSREVYMDLLQSEIDYLTFSISHYKEHRFQKQRDEVNILTLEKRKNMLEEELENLSNVTSDKFDKYYLKDDSASHEKKQGKYDKRVELLNSQINRLSSMTNSDGIIAKRRKKQIDKLNKQIVKIQKRQRSLMMRGFNVRQRNNKVLAKLQAQQELAHDYTQEYKIKRDNAVGIKEVYYDRQYNKYKRSSIKFNDRLVDLQRSYVREKGYRNLTKNVAYVRRTIESRTRTLLHGGYRPVLA